jgi:hypothetical protein
MTHELIISLVDTYVTENEKFEKGNKLAGTRARRALAEIAKLSKIRRKQIQDLKNNNK